MWSIKMEEEMYMDYTGKNQEKALEYRTEKEKERNQGEKGDGGAGGGSDHPLSSNQAQML